MNVNSIEGARPPSSNFATASPAQAAQTRKVSEAVRALNDSSLIPSDRELTVSLDPKTKIPVVKVIDAKSGEVLDQVPVEYILKLTAFLEAQAAEESAAQKSHP